jgi:hypothetical protein
MATFQARRRAGFVVGIFLALSACSDGAPTAPVAQLPDPVGEAKFSPIVGAEVSPSAVISPDSLVELPLLTYEGSGQTVHPDLAVFDHPWHGYEYWMAITPYPNSNSAFENPSLLAGHDGTAWVPPPGVHNPLIDKPDGANYNSDPDIVYDSLTDELMLMYRVAGAGHNSIYTTRSHDGVFWTQPRLAFSVTAHRAISPAVVVASPGAHGAPQVWYVDAGTLGCHATHSAVVTRIAQRGPLGELIDAHWLPALPTRFDQPGRVIWHIDVQWVPEKHEYWALYPAYARSRACGSSSLYFARSTDGMTWRTYRRPLIKRGSTQATSASLYRATFQYDARSDHIRIWTAALGADAEWRLLYGTFDYSPLLRRLEQAP